MLLLYCLECGTHRAIHPGIKAVSTARRPPALQPHAMVWRSLYALSILSKICNSAAQSSRPKGIYGEDDRLDESSASGISDALRSVATGATVALISKTKLVYDQSSNTWSTTSTSTLGTSQNLCVIDPATGTQPVFFDQLNPSTCSGTVVHWNATTQSGLVASAGHCFDSDSAANGCQHSAGGLSAPPIYGTSADLQGSPTDFPYFFVFDFT